MAELLAAEGLELRLGDREVLSGVDLSLSPGQHSLLLGPSGSGKTSLIRVLAQLIDPDAGRVLFEGRDLKTLGCPRRFRLQHVGMIFQGVHLLESMTVRQNIEMVQAAARPVGSRHIPVDELLEPLGLGSRAEERVVHLSRGERQRVGLARAFSNAPRLVLADEPTASLDSVARGQCLDHFFALCARCETTALVTSHNESLAERIEFQQVVKLREGGLTPA